MDDIKEKVIELFENYFTTVENEYNMSNDQIQYLKDKVKKDVKTMSFIKDKN